MNRLIDADNLHTLLVKEHAFGELSAKKAIRAIEQAPTVDAVPVDWLLEQEESVSNSDAFRDECAGVRLAWMAEAERREE